MTRQELKDKYPDLFKDVYCGFDSVPGWNSLIDFMCSAIMKRQKEGDPIPSVVQVKEKFGGLRFYLDRANKTQYDIAQWGEFFSYIICEQCGTTHDVTTSGGWLKTLCSACREKEKR